MAVSKNGSLEASVLEWVCEHSQLDAGESIELDGDTNLIEKAGLDSVGFLELIQFVEKRTGQRIDLSAVDPKDLVSINGLCRHVKHRTFGAD